MAFSYDTKPISSEQLDAEPIDTVLGKVTVAAQPAGDGLYTLTGQLSAVNETSTRWQRVQVAHLMAVGEAGRKIGVDRKNEVIHGWILAQAGPFKSDGRGEFDDKSLALILSQARKAPNGLKSRLAHPNESNDGIGKLLGRVKDPYPDFVVPKESEGQPGGGRVACVRGDLHIDPSAHKAEFDMAEWLMTVCESDPDAISSSLVLDNQSEYRIKPDGTPMLDADGDPLPPLWRPTVLHASDCVDTGDAVDGLLSASIPAEALSAMPNGLLWQAEKMLNQQFAGKDREFIEGHLLTFLYRYLDRRFTGEKLTGLERRNRKIESERDSTIAAALNGTLEERPAVVVGSERILQAGPAHRLAMGEDGPAGDVVPTEQAGPKHDGCRSTLAFHSVTLCRLCGAEMSGCGCDHRGLESRVTILAKEPCAACLAADPSHDGAPASPPDTPDQAPDPENPQGVSKLPDRRRLELDAMTFEED
jgi:hypothetical protein